MVVIIVCSSFFWLFFVSLYCLFYNHTFQTSPTAKQYMLTYCSFFPLFTFCNSYGRRCAVFDVIVLNSTKHLNHRGSMVHNCSYQITAGVVPSFIYSNSVNLYANKKFPSNSFERGSSQYPDVMWQFTILLPLVSIFVCCLFGCCVQAYRINENKLKAKDAALRKLQDAKSEAWKIPPDHIFMSGVNPKLGEGAFGVVLKAKYGTTPVAVKQFHAGSTVSDSEFIGEMTALQDLRHPNIVQLIGACKLDAVKGNTAIPGGWSIVSEFLRGGDVEELLHEKKTVAVSMFNRIQIAWHAARGMAYLHDQGLVHKDIKTANLMLSGHVDDSSNFTCKVADFGCSTLNKKKKIEKNETANNKGTILLGEMKKRATSLHELTHLASVEKSKFKGGPEKDNGSGGTAIYLPPEVQLPDEEYCEHGDVFAFGIVLAELITRTPPYSNTGYSAQAVILNVGSKGLRPIKPGSNDVPAEDDPLHYMYELAKQCWLPAYGQPCKVPSDWSSRPKFMSKDKTGGDKFLLKTYSMDDFLKNNHRSVELLLEKMWINAQDETSSSYCKPKPNQEMKYEGNNDGNGNNKSNGNGSNGSNGSQTSEVTDVVGWQEQSWYDSTTYQRSTTYNETSDHGELTLWWYDYANINNGSFGLSSFGGSDPNGSGRTSMSEPINGSAAHLLPVSNSEQSASFGRSSFMASNDEDTKVGYANQDQSNLQTPSYYIKTLWVEHYDGDTDGYNTFSKEIMNLKKLRHSNILNFLSCQLIQEDESSWKFNLIYDNTNGIRYKPMSTYMKTQGNKIVGTTIGQKNQKNQKNQQHDIGLSFMLNVCSQIASALEWLHNPNKSGGAMAHLHLNLNTVMIGKENSNNNSPKGTESTAIIKSNSTTSTTSTTSKIPTLTSRAKWQVKLCALELEMVTGSAYCEDDIYESNTNAPAFVAPELLLGGDGSIETDVYSFGILLWCAMTRRIPFEKEAPRSIGRLVLGEKRRPEYTMHELSQIPQDVMLVQLMSECWTQSTKDRKTMSEVRLITDKLWRRTKNYNSINTSIKRFRRTLSDKKNVVVPNGEEKKEELEIKVVEVEVEMVKMQ